MGGLFGSSLDELAQREIELKKNKGISNVEVQKKATKTAKLGKPDKIIISCVLIFGLSFVLWTIYTVAISPKADYVAFNKALTSYLDENKDIVEITTLESNMFKVVVTDDWYNSSEVEKLRFCKNVHATLFVYAQHYHLIDKHASNIYMNFYDTTDIMVAEQDFFEFKILH